MTSQSGIKSEYDFVSGSTKGVCYIGAYFWTNENIVLFWWVALWGEYGRVLRENIK